MYGFISWRISSATIDQKWPRGRAIFEMLSAYNRGVVGAGGDMSMLVDVPASSDLLVHEARK
jgi:hypothetical protein